MRIKYDADDDVLHIEFSKDPIIKDVSHGWNNDSRRKEQRILAY